jgi:hypothetical protein
VPRSGQPSAAVQLMAEDLSVRGLVVGCRSIEEWGRVGLAPAPTRRALGRGRGSVTEYPPGAADQYAAVAGVMRRGRPWQVAVLMLLARGTLPADEQLLRAAFRDVLAPDPAKPGEDSLSRAERVAALAVAAPAVRPFVQVMRSNLNRCSPMLDPGSAISSVAEGAVATIFLAAAGDRSWSDGALAEMLAALGAPVAGMEHEELAQAVRMADTWMGELVSGPALAAVAATAPASRILASVPAARETLAEIRRGPDPALPRRLDPQVIDILSALTALILIRIEDLGGIDTVMTRLAARASAHRVCQQPEERLSTPA